MAVDLFAKYNCTYCQDDITGLRVRCVDCADFDLCLQCFSAGAEIGTHKNDHAYQFVDSGALDMFRGRSTSWSAREEMDLLNGIEKHGFGNWEDISNHIKTRSIEEAREEYMSRFLEGSIGQATWPDTSSARPHLSDLTSADSGPLSPALTSRLPPLDISHDEATQLGYMTLRDDFDREYDNDAEVLVSSLKSAIKEDDDLDVGLKLAQVDMYCRRLRERARRKRVCKDYQLVAQFFASRRDRPKKKVAKEEREFEERLRSYCQFHTALEHEQFASNLLHERSLSRRLAELLRYRRNGLTRVEELPHFEQERLARHNDKRSAGSSALTAQVQNFPVTKKKKKRSEANQLCSTTKKSTPYTESPTSWPHATKPHWQPPQQQQLQLLSENSHDASSHLLSSTETQLCSALEMSPTQFISTKTLLLSDPFGQIESPCERSVLEHIANSGWILAHSYS